ncbi:hypothetical protein [Eleftheria terrae]|uniref:hypothetical protein n=1 Tax=Eleftheria terrae TaxID=1597781 RepID=UPI00263B68E0|nr:hypothetical protein [Eleftheria terrae]WKB50547.1 hypothetical protein N7L95_00065 [Eleftheria terrae]
MLKKSEWVDRFANEFGRRWPGISPEGAYEVALDAADDAHGWLEPEEAADLEARQWQWLAGGEHSHKDAP